MRGKYSPTVNAAYQKDQNWWDNFREEEDYGGVRLKSPYDKEGYNSYGYDKNGLDRAGQSENAYAFNDLEDEDVNFAYEQATSAWGFDGEKPVISLTSYPNLVY